MKWWLHIWCLRQRVKFNSNEELYQYQVEPLCNLHSQNGILFCNIQLYSGKKLKLDLIKTTRNGTGEKKGTVQTLLPEKVSIKSFKWIFQLVSFVNAPTAPSNTTPIERVAEEERERKESAQIPLLVLAS